ncbi:MAG: tail fiber domain-containing protein, partial [Saprospiraceae bacterium]|nr:tail fiber domain-containing protein [Saprospiraceae bacterium]
LSVPYAFFAGKAANATGGDPDSTNEIQTLSKTGNQIQLSKNGGAVTDAVNDADASPTNELQALSQNGTTVTLSQNGGTISVADNDNDPANELQSLSLLGNTLSISGGNSVSLAGLGGSQWLNNPNGIHYGNLTGNVGIGTASPQTRLDIRSPDGNAEETMFNLRKDNGAGAARNFLIKMRSAVPEVVLTTDGTGGHPRLTLGPAGGASSFLTITPNENAGINTNNPEAGLDILRSNGAPALRVTKSAGTEHIAIFRRDPNPAFAPVMVMTRQGFVGLGTDAPQEALHVVGHICYTGSIFTCSDSRYKTGLQPLAGALDKISRISGQYYFWDRAGYPEKGFSDQRQIGLLAQEVEQYFPEIVHTDADGYKSVDYSRLTPVLIEALKAQQQQIERLNAQVEKLERMEARLEALEREIKRDGSE